MPGVDERNGALQATFESAVLVETDFVRVFVTTMTDCVGFFAFLGLAALWLV